MQDLSLDDSWKSFCSGLLSGWQVCARRSQNFAQMKRGEELSRQGSAFGEKSLQGKAAKVAKTEEIQFCNEGF